MPVEIPKRLTSNLPRLIKASVLVTELRHPHRSAVMEMLNRFTLKCRALLYEIFRKVLQGFIET